MWWITACCLFVKTRWSHLKTTQALMDIWQASETSHSKNIIGNFQHQCLNKLFINVYSYHLWWIVCLAVVCVEGAFSQIQSQICTSSNGHGIIMFTDDINSPLHNKSRVTGTFITPVIYSYCSINFVFSPNKTSVILKWSNMGKNGALYVYMCTFIQIL